MIVLTGATGGLGSSVFKHLLKLVPTSEITVSLYNPSGASELIKSSGVTIKQASYTDPASLDAAWAGAEKLLIVSYPGISKETRVAAHKNAIDAAKRLGIEHVYYTSLGFASGKSDQSVAYVMQAHLETEKYLKESGLTYTILREGIYSESWPLYLGFWKKGEKRVVIPRGDGDVAWVSREDLGEGTAIILAEGYFENETVCLTGQRTFNLTEITNMLHDLAPSVAPMIDWVPIDTYVSYHSTHQSGPRGDPEFLKQWATTYEALERGECAVRDLTLARVLGRDLKGMRETLVEMVGAEKEDAVDRYAK